MKKQKKKVANKIKTKIAKKININTIAGGGEKGKQNCYY